MPAALPFWEGTGKWLIQLCEQPCQNGKANQDQVYDVYRSMWSVQYNMKFTGKSDAQVNQPKCESVHSYAFLVKLSIPQKSNPFE